MSSSPEVEQVLGSSLGVERDFSSSRGHALTTNAAREEDARSGHTPGPWMADRHPGGWWDVLSNDHPICLVENADAERFFGPAPFVSDEACEANARLIAAAPDLLEAAQLLEAAEDFNANDCPECEGDGVPELCGTCFPMFDDARIARRLAIAKALGTERAGGDPSAAPTPPTTQDAPNNRGSNV